MRLICPNCDAQYEIADNAIPSDGREVQCSNCGHTWFQEHPYHSSENATTDDNRIDSLQNDDILFDDEELTLRQQPARRELHPSVSNILREEAELEKKARVKIPEDQSAPDPKSEKIEGKNIIDDGIMPNTEQLPKSPKKPDVNSHSDQKNRSTGEQNSGNKNTQKVNSSFAYGFNLMISLALILAIIYFFAPQIAQQVPQTDPYLSNFVTHVDSMRSWIHTQAIGLLDWLDTMKATQNE